MVEKQSIKISAELLDALKDEQYRRRKSGQTEPTYAALLDELWLERASGSTTAGAGGAHNVRDNSAEMVDSSQNLSDITTTKQLTELQELAFRLAERLGEFLVRIKSDSGDSVHDLSSSGGLLAEAEQELGTTRKSDAALIREAKKVATGLRRTRKGTGKRPA